ncbi:MAG: galactokinase [Opitutaceae bacterium]|jgi:galactonate dehydratase|nr:galactokinase [Opitutaceae bacterium]
MRIQHVESRLIGGAHFVEITTECGLIGLGQSACWGYPAAVSEVVAVFSEYLIGKDAGNIEQHWQHLYRMGPFRGSVVGGALSAVDIALWDIKGQRFGVPIWELLGGKCRDRLRLLLLMLGDFTPDEVATKIRDGVSQGYTAVKFDPIPTNSGDMSFDRLVSEVNGRVESARDAAGKDVDIVLELHRRLTPLTALPLIDQLLKFNCLFIEDPVQIDSISSQADMAARSTAPIANGERLNTIWEYRELLAQGGSQYLRPDPGLAGGITHCKKIAAIGESYHSAVVTHNFLGPVLTAASAHLVTSIPNFVVLEYSDIDEGPAAQGYISHLKREGGDLLIPDTPGLGVSLNPDMPDISLSPLKDPLHKIPLRRDGSVAWSV